MEVSSPINISNENAHRGHSMVSPAAVRIQQGWKSFGLRASATPILKGLDMTVQEGSIYTLIGASGCGKTTLLSCIIGTKRLDEGEVRVFGDIPSTPGSGVSGQRIGYMPQEISIYQELKIFELFEYFGRIYGMTQKEIGDQTQSLSKLLDLPKSSRIVRTLSGGQQRRVSLAIALLHEPPLLILDEPTVGIDPLLRESIWNHLFELVEKKHTTVIITTHYIEEARNSHTLGIMRNGRLLAEKSPRDLLADYSTDYLEDVVLELCKNDAEGQPVPDIIMANIGEYPCRRQFLQKDIPVVGLAYQSIIIDKHNQTNPRRLKHSNSSGTVRRNATRCNQIKAVSSKNAKLFSRELMLLLITVAIPTMNLATSSLVLGKAPTNIRVGVVNPEVNFDLSGCEGLVQGCSTEKLSCSFLQSFPTDYLVPISKTSRDAAVQGITNEGLVGFMEFPNGYSNHSLQRYAYGRFSDNETIDGSTVSVYVAWSEFIVARSLLYNIHNAFQKNLKQHLLDCGRDPREAELPLEFRKPIYDHNDFENRGWVEPLLLFCAVLLQFYLPAARCLLNKLDDKESGTHERSMIAGASFETITLGYMIVHGMNVILQALVAYFSMKLFFISEVKGSDLDGLIIMILTGICGVSFSFLLAEVFDHSVEAYPILLCFFMPSLYLCGYISPVACFPQALQLLRNYFLPYALAMDSLNNIVFKGWPLMHPKVLPGFLFTIGWTVIFWILARLVKWIRSEN